MKKQTSSCAGPKWLTREVAGFGLTSFFSDLSHEVATTLLAVFLASLGAPAYAVGLIEGISDGLANIARLFGGWASDRSGKRKPLALIGYFVTGATQGLFAFVTWWPEALLARAAGWFGRGFRTPIRDALFHDAVTKETSGRAFGFERMMDTAGAVIAPLFAFFFVPKIGFRGVFMLTWIPGILAALCFLFFVKERGAAHASSFSLFHGIRNFSPGYKRFLSAAALFGLADFSHTLLIYWAGVSMAPLYGAAKASRLAILLYAFHNVIYAAASYPMGFLADKFGKLRVLGLGYALACVMFAALMTAKKSFPFFAFVFFIGGLYVAVQDTVERAAAGDLLPREIKGTGYGVLASLNGIGDLLSSLIVGSLISLASPALAFGYCFVLGLCGALFIFRIGRD